MLAATLAIAVAGGQITACAKNPVTGKQQLSLISESQEIELGQQASAETAEAIGLVEDASLQRYVQGVGMDLARDSERPSLPWSFQVLDDPTPNAFAYPGGFIFITRGMLSLMDSEAELAAVLGHEIGHVTAKHTVTRISEAQVAQLGLGVGSILFPELQAISGLAGVGLQLLFLDFSRDDEREADELGFRYALAENYDVREMDDIFVSLDAIQQTSGRSPLPTWASTHPAPAERVATLRARQQQLEGPVETLVVGRERFYSEIDGLVYGDDPRNGFFSGDTFFHPDLAFEVTFPDGWQTQNLPQLVVATAPGGEAAMQLGMARGTPKQAAQQFLSQRGIRAGQLRQERINGMDAVMADFVASTSQGNIAGLVTYIAHDRGTFGIIGLTSPRRLDNYGRTFLASMGSFDEVTDPDVLGVDANRIDIIELTRSMTLSEVLRRYRSSIGLSDMALINQVRDRDRSLPAGTLLKRVVGGPDLVGLGALPTDVVSAP